MNEVAILKAFDGMPDKRRKQGTRHSLQLCLALFTLSVAAGNQGFLALGDWLKYHHDELKDLFNVERIPSYSAIRRVLLRIDYLDYATRLAEFLGVKPEIGETISLDGKTLKGSYLVQKDNPESQPHPAIILVTAYLVDFWLNLTTSSSRLR